MDLVATSTLGEPLAGLHSEELERFAEGREEFIEEEDIEDGLGPVFNEASCVACHNAPVGGTNGRLETRFGKFVAGKFDAMPKWGGSLMQDHGIGAIHTEHGAYNYVAEVMPPSSNVKAGRVTTPLFGLGLVDAVPDASLLALAAQQARFTPSTAEWRTW
jgi:cytochrome c peroxidase